MSENLDATYDAVLSQMGTYIQDGSVGEMLALYAANTDMITLDFLVREVLIVCHEDGSHHDPQMIRWATLVRNGDIDQAFSDEFTRIGGIPEASG